MLKKILILLSLIYTYSIANFSSTSNNSWNYQFDEYSDLGGILDENKAFPDYIIDSSTLDAMLNSVPEYHNAPIEHPEYFPSSEPEIIISITAEVFITFYSEGACFRNSLGYYTYEGDTNRSAPTSKAEVQANGIIVYPNVSLHDSRGDLSLGTSVSLGTLTKGTKIMFFLISNGWRGNTTGIWNSTDWLFSTLSKLNKEYDVHSQKVVPDDRHVAMLWENTGSGNILLMGFEDILRTNTSCDHDFNDAIFSVSTSPLSSLKSSTISGSGSFKKIIEIQDSDGDGVNDAFDKYPEDSERAYDQYYPSKNNNATLIFEDRWPYEGDYDMNDLSILFSIKETRSSQKKIKDIVFSGSIQAYGAAYTNGFGLLIDTPLSNIESAQVSVNGGEKTDITAELLEDNRSTYIKLFSDAAIYLEHFSNVYKDDTFVQSDTFQLYLTFYDTQTLSAPPYNPFMLVSKYIIIDGESVFRDNIEIHLPGHPPSSYAEPSLFGTASDQNKIDYLSRDNKPWALLIPSIFAHPVEQVNIGKAYNYFNDWVKSNGTTHYDWYLHNKLDNTNQTYGNDSKIIIRSQ